MIGKRKALQAPWQVPLPSVLQQKSLAGAQALTLRDLLACVVHEELQSWQQRQAERRFLHILQSQEILDAARSGKISMGGDQDLLPASLQEEDALEVALQAFRDGLYLVFLDKQKVSALDTPVTLAPESTLLFIRLVALVGG